VSRDDNVNNNNNKNKNVWPSKYGHYRVVTKTEPSGPRTAPDNDTDRRGRHIDDNRVCYQGQPLLVSALVRWSPVAQGIRIHRRRRRRLHLVARSSFAHSLTLVLWFGHVRRQLLFPFPSSHQTIFQ